MFQSSPINLAIIQKVMRETCMINDVETNQMEIIILQWCIAAVGSGSAYTHSRLLATRQEDENHFQHCQIVMSLAYIAMVQYILLKICLSFAVASALPGLPMTFALDASKASVPKHLPSLPSGIPDGLFIKNGSTYANFRSNLSFYDVLPATLNAYPVCDRDRYGHNLDRASCEEALQKIGSSFITFTVSQRSSAFRPSMKLPNRWSSCKCGSTYNGKVTFL